MPTTIHLPPALLKSVDRRASELGLSRNRYIRRALEGAVARATGWSSGFLNALAAAARDRSLQAGVDEMMRVITLHRRSRSRPPRL